MTSQTQSIEAADAGAMRRAVPAGSWREAAAAGLGVAVIALLPLLVNDRFYFNDDYQSYFMPMFREIARLLLAGEFPLSTPRIWFGGALAGEYQYAVFHPVCLALYVILSGIGNLAAAATLYALFHIFLLGAGFFALCRHLGCALSPAFIGALIGCTSSWLLYWGASNWIPALVSEAWAVWALFLVLLAGRSPGYVPAAAIATAFTLLSGWPFTDLALLIAIAALAGIAVAARTGADAVWRAGVALLAGALLAMPALLTAAGYLAESGREADVPHLWSLTLNGLFSAGVPSAVEVWSFEEGVYRPSTGVQMLYASWLTPLALALGNWPALWRERRWTLAAVLTVTILFALVSMMPGVWHFRWFFRLLPFYHAGLAVLTALLLTYAAPACGRWRWRYPLALTAVMAPFLIPVSIDPRTNVLTVLFGTGVLAALIIALDLGRRNEKLFRIGLIGGHVAVLLMMVSVWPRSIQVPRWDYPAAGPQERARIDGDAVRRLALYDSSLEEEPGGPYWSMIALGNTAAYLDAETVNGYSPPVQKGLARLFCFDFKGGVCAEDAAERLFAPRFNGLNLLDLAGIEEVATDSPGLADAFSTLAGRGWRVVAREGPYTVFRREGPAPGGLAAPPPEGIALEEIGHSARRMIFGLTPEPGFAGGELIIRRPWYPGVYATLNGRPLKAETLERAMPVVHLPRGAEGRLVVGYWPKGLTPGLLLAGLGALLLAAAWRWPRQTLTAPRPFAALWRRVTSPSSRPSEDSSPA